MQPTFEQKCFHNVHGWRRFFMLWLTIFLWAAFLVYMLLFHFYRAEFEPLVMNHFGVMLLEYYQFAEIKLFMYLLWACCLISVLAIINTWNKKRQEGDKMPDKYLCAMMMVSVSFVFYYVKTDLDYLNGQLPLLSILLGER